MSQGIIYYNRGFKCIVRLIVCIESLRKFYSGNITLFQDGDHDKNLMKDLQKNFGMDIIYDMNPNTATLVRKIEVSQKSSYDYTILIDADMLIVGKIDEIFETVKNYEFVATQFANWKSNGGTIRGRILRFKESYPQYMDDAIGFGPAINTGVYAFPKGTPFLNEWLPVAKTGEKMHTWIPDEVACQILLPRYKTHVLSTKFNVSVKYDPDTEDKRILHFHGKKHVIQKPLCALWIDAFHKVCINNVCNIRKFIDRKYGDRRLNKFFNGKYGWKKKIKAVKKTLLDNSVKNDYKLKDNPQDITIVTACDPKYIEHLAITFPNWVKYKRIDQFPMIVYINGFKGGINDSLLNFIKKQPNIKILEWDFPEATSQREKMLSSFIFGTSRDISTKYWIKLDADAFFTDEKDLILEEMKDYDIYGHKWGYTKPARWIKELDLWASKLPVFNNTKPIFDPKNVNGNKYEHKRIASYVQFHKTEFVKKAAEIAGKRCPVPSHDTYLWYVAERLGYKWHRHNFKRFSGVTNTSKIEKLRRKIKEIDNNIQLKMGNNNGVN